MPAQDVVNIILYSDEPDEFKAEYERKITAQDIPEEEDICNDKYGKEDNYINMVLVLPRGDGEHPVHATVKKRAIDSDGRPMGVKNVNPVLDTRLYEFKYVMGKTERLTANVIAEILLAQVDHEGRKQMLMSKIEDHCKGADAVPMEQGFYEGANGVRRKKITTKGWDFFVRWKDGSVDWVALKYLKDSYPVNLADYAVRNQLHEYPAFAWWVPYVQKKRTAIIKKVKSKY